MAHWLNFPVVYEINAWVWLNELSRKLGRRITLQTVPQEELERWAAHGFDALWLMGVWQRSPKGRQSDLKHPGKLADYRRALPDYLSKDVVGSPYAVYNYKVDPALGGNEELASLRERLQQLNIHLILDFVPNHLAVDHPWLETHPERFVQGEIAQLHEQPYEYFLAHNWVFAHGRDPQTGAWPDTVQLDYRNADTRQAMQAVLAEIATLCDGVRCDMAMLVLRDVFCDTWGGAFDPPDAEFWPEAIAQIKGAHPHFLMMAEVYWDNEHRMHQQGFDYAYDKRLYDRLIGDDIRPVRDHLRGASFDYQSKLVRFVENHDEQRILMVLGRQRSQASTVVALTLPGLRLVHDGQIEGRRVKMPVQLGRRLTEDPDPTLEDFYQRLFQILDADIFHNGQWQWLEPRSASPGNNSHSHFVAYRWAAGPAYWLVAVNLSSSPSQCFIPLDKPELGGRFWSVEDALSGVAYIRDGDRLAARGFYLDIPGYHYHIFRLTPWAESDFVAWQPVADKGAGFRRRCELQRYEEGLYGLAWSPDGTRLALAGWEKVIWVLNTENFRCERVLRGHDGTISSVAWSPDGQQLASGSFDRTVRLWDAASGALRHTFAGHDNNVLSVSWSPDGKLLASGALDRTVYLWDVASGKECYIFREHEDDVNWVAWSPAPDRPILASGAGDKTICLWDAAAHRLLRKLNAQDWVGCLAWSADGAWLAAGTGSGLVDVWNVATGQRIAVCQGHTYRILGVTFSPDGRLLATKAADATVRLWRCADWSELITLKEYGRYLSGVAFHPTQPFLLTRDDSENLIHLWELDVDHLLEAASPHYPSRYINIKVALLGDKGVGKSALGYRLANGDFAPTASTYGARTWQAVLPEPPGLPADVKVDLTLWDLAGQFEYRLVHQLFLDDTDVALVLFDASDPREPFRDVAYWANVLEKQAPNALKFLVAGRCDVSRPVVSDQEIQRVVQQYNFQGYIPTSAATGEGVEALRQQLRDKLPWDKLLYTAMPQLLLTIRRYLADRELERVLIPLDEVQAEVGRYYAGQETPHEGGAEALAKVLTILQSQGIIYCLDIGAEKMLLLRPELINQYVSAIIQAAREERPGKPMGVLAEPDVLYAKLPFTGFERLKPGEEEIVLKATVELLIRHNLCFNEMNWLVFPSQMSYAHIDSFMDRARPVVAYYFSGSVEAIYASLVVRLHYTGSFQLEAQWRYAAAFLSNQHRLGFVMRQQKDGVGELEIYFSDEAGELVQFTFINFIREHLKFNGLLLEERIHLYCPQCGKEIVDYEAVKANKAQGLPDVLCQYCRTAVPIPPSIEDRCRDDSALARQQQRLDRTADRRTEKERERLHGDSVPYTLEQESAVIRLLHLADLCIQTEAQARLYLTQLTTDLGEVLEINRLEYLVIAGGVTVHATPSEYQAAFSFLDGLVKHFGLDASRVILVPGDSDINSDLSQDAYEYVPPGKLSKDIPEAHRIGSKDVTLVRNEKLYQQRFDYFNDFYKKVYKGIGYSLLADEQFFLLPRPEERLLFLALNSAWEIDHHYKDRAGIHTDALARAIEKLHGGGYDDWLKIAVWHHPVGGSHAMDDSCLALLVNNGFQICLHGHCEHSCHSVYACDDRRSLSIIGGGPFGAPVKGGRRAMTLHYNLLSLDLDAHLLTVETRKKEKSAGAWLADARWGDRNNPTPRYTLPLQGADPAAPAGRDFQTPTIITRRGIAPDLCERLRAELSRCGELFDSDSSLRAVFVDDRIAGWRDSVREASSRAQRVNGVIDALFELPTTTGENALVIFLRVLSERFSPETDKRYTALQALAAELERGAAS